MLQTARASQGGERMRQRGCNIPAERVRDGHNTSVIGVVDEAQPAHVSVARKARQGKEPEDALVQIQSACAFRPHDRPMRDASDLELHRPKPFGSTSES